MKETLDSFLSSGRIPFRHFLQQHRAEYCLHQTADFLQKYGLNLTSMTYNAVVPTSPGQHTAGSFVQTVLLEWCPNLVEFNCRPNSTSNLFTLPDTLFTNPLPKIKSFSGSVCVNQSWAELFKKFENLSSFTISCVAFCNCISILAKSLSQFAKKTKNN